MIAGLTASRYWSRWRVPFSSVAIALRSDFEGFQILDALAEAQDLFDELLLGSSYRRLGSRAAAARPARPGSSCLALVLLLSSIHMPRLRRAAGRSGRSGDFTRLSGQGSRNFTLTRITRWSGKVFIPARPYSLSATVHLLALFSTSCTTMPVAWPLGSALGAGRGGEGGQDSVMTEPSARLSIWLCKEADPTGPLPGARSTAFSRTNASSSRESSARAPER